MFDKTIIENTKTEHVPYAKTVTHNYATTTEQAKYLKDLEKEALDKIINLSLYDAKPFDAQLSFCEMHLDPAMLNKKAFIAFVLNGKKIRVEVDCNEKEIEGIAKALSAAIADKLIGEIAPKLMSDIYKNGSVG